MFLNIKRNVSFIAVFCIFILTFFSFTSFAEILPGHQDHLEGKTFEVYDEEGEYIFATGRTVTVGDRYISSDNIEYTIKEVKENTAIARKLGSVNLLAGAADEVSLMPPMAQDDERAIGIFHTHNGESYLPGEPNVEGNGDIYDVGKTLKSRLEERNIDALHSANLHLPHDGASYERSRATALELARSGVDALFDVHRDAIPRREEYLERVNNQLISQVRLVVGRQNPNNSVNDQFARRLKAVADEHYPGLIKDIFYGNGNYNQQIAPHSLLLEFGTYVTSKEQAQASTVMFADVVNRLLYGEGAEGLQEAESRSGVFNALWIIIFAAAGILLYLYINKGSWEEIWKEIKRFFGRTVRD